MRTKVRIVHETNPEKYFPAIFHLDEKRKIQIVGAHRYSVVKESFRSILMDRRTLSATVRNALSDLSFRFRIPFIKNEVVILGFAPWDWRILLYLPLIVRNQVVYHTSWANWEKSSVPRTYSLLTGLVRRLWVFALSHENVSIVAVHPTSANSVSRVVRKAATVITHSVSNEFFGAGGDQVENEKVRLLYVGELSEKKGVDRLIRLFERLPSENVQLTIVGDGPLRRKCTETARNPNVEYLGTIENRKELADIMASNDVLCLLSVKKSDWEELFGIVIIEALAAGMTVISSHHVGPKYIFRGYPKANLFWEDEDSLILERLLKFISDREVLERSKSYVHEIPSSYSIESVSEKWEHLINNLSKNISHEEFK